MVRFSTGRILAAAVLMAVVYGVTVLMGQISGVSKSVAMPKISITTMPKEFGDWKGEDREVGAREFHAIGATKVVSREYRNSAGEVIVVHIATFGDYWRLTPHSPLVCYPSNGFTKSGERVVELPNSDGCRVDLVEFSKKKRTNLVAFWYQFGDQVFLNDEELSEAQRAYRGVGESWPSIIKVLLDSSQPHPKQFEPEFLEFASQIRMWSKDLQEGRTNLNKADANGVDDTGNPKSAEQANGPSAS
ncbi:MAG: EpsI family protein [Pirellulales bacterium]|nr:EpsI family protein [Pirellulales bacterium]